MSKQELAGHRGPMLAQPGIQVPSSLRTTQLTLGEPVCAKPVPEAVVLNPDSRTERGPGFSLVSSQDRSPRGSPLLVPVLRCP